MGKVDEMLYLEEKSGRVYYDQKQLTIIHLNVRHYTGVKSCWKVIILECHRELVYGRKEKICMRNITVYLIVYPHTCAKFGLAVLSQFRKNACIYIWVRILIGTALLFIFKNNIYFAKNFLIYTNNNKIFTANVLQVSLADTFAD